MPASFPTSLASFTTKVTGDVIEAAHVNGIQDEVVAEQTKVGINASAVATTLDYLLKNTASSDPGHKHSAGAITSGTLAVARGGTNLTTIGADRLLGANTLDTYVAVSLSAYLTMAGATLDVVNLVKTNAINTITANSASTILTLNQQGAGSIFDAQSDAQALFSVIRITGLTSNQGYARLGKSDTPDTDTNNLFIIGADSDTGQRWIVRHTQSSATAGNGAAWIFQRQRGTFASKTIVQSGDNLAALYFHGYDGATFPQAAAIFAEVDGTPGVGDMPGRLIFSTTADGASTVTERLRISNIGALITPSTITAVGTTGNQTINKPCGRVNIAAAGTTVTVTNSLVTANSIILVVPATNDTTARITNVVPAAGSFVINTVAVTAETAFNFFVIS